MGLAAKPVTSPQAIQHESRRKEQAEKRRLHCEVAGAREAAEAREAAKQRRWHREDTEAHEAAELVEEWPVPEVIQVDPALWEDMGDLLWDARSGCTNALWRLCPPSVTARVRQRPEPVIRIVECPVAAAAAAAERARSPGRVLRDNLAEIAMCRRRVIDLEYLAFEYDPEKLKRNIHTLASRWHCNYLGISRALRRRMVGDPDIAGHMQNRRFAWHIMYPLLFLSEGVTEIERPAIAYARNTALRQANCNGATGGGGFDGRRPGFLYLLVGNHRSGD